MKMKVFLMLVVCFFQELQSSSSFRPIASRVEASGDAWFEEGKKGSDQLISHIQYIFHGTSRRLKSRTWVFGKNKTTLSACFVDHYYNFIEHLLHAHCDCHTLKEFRV